MGLSKTQIEPEIDPIKECGVCECCFGDGGAPHTCIRDAKLAQAPIDAKHGEGKPDYSECPNCHVTLYRSATDTHERRHEIRDGGESK